MKLWIVRHGEAEPRKTTDAERALTAHGKKEAHAAGKCLAQLVGANIVALASPYVRAQQTAKAVLAEIAATIPLHTVDWCTPEDNPLAALDHLAFREESELLLVSHMPMVSSLTGLLVHGDMRAGPPFHTASVAELEMSTVSAGAAQLLSLRHPPEFRKSQL